MGRVISIFSHKITDKKLKKIFLKNGDVYDSQIELWEEGVLLWKGICNVDSSNNIDNNKKKEGIQKIEIANGFYYGVVGLHKNKYKAILIINSNLDIQDWSKIEEKYRILPANSINAIWGKPIVKYVNIHKGGWDWDWSAGCITILGDYYEKFISFFSLNEKVEIIKN